MLSLAGFRFLQAVRLKAPGPCCLLAKALPQLLPHAPLGQLSTSGFPQADEEKVKQERRTAGGRFTGSHLGSCLQQWKTHVYCFSCYLSVSLMYLGLSSTVLMCRHVWVLMCVHMWVHLSTCCVILSVR